MTCGIYLIENKKTRQKYIGQSVNFNKIKNKVVSDGYPWEVKDNDKYESFLKEYNIKR